MWTMTRFIGQVPYLQEQVTTSGASFLEMDPQKIHRDFMADIYDA